MRSKAFLLASCLLVACGQDEPTSPGDTLGVPTLSHTFEVSPVRSPGGTSHVVVTFAVPADLEVTHTELVIAGTDRNLLPSPWAALYGINGRVLSAGRSEQDPGTWELRIQFRNESAVVCSSCEAVSAEYDIWD